MIRRLRVHPGLWFFWIVVGWVYVTNAEGRYWPAAAPMKLIGAFPTISSRVSDFKWQQIGENGTHTAFWVESARLRPECSFVGFDWRLGERAGQSVPVTIQPGPPIIRDNGVFFAGPWIAWIKVENFHKTFSDVIHRCRILGVEMPWVLKSRFWR